MQRLRQTLTKITAAGWLAITVGGLILLSIVMPLLNSIFNPPRLEVVTRTPSPDATVATNTPIAIAVSFSDLDTNQWAIVDNTGASYAVSKTGDKSFLFTPNQNLNVGLHTVRVFYAGQELSSWSFNVTAGDLGEQLDPTSRPDDYQIVTGRQPNYQALDNALPLRGPNYSIEKITGKYYINYSTEIPESLQGAILRLEEFGVDLNNPLVVLAPYFN